MKSSIKTLAKFVFIPIWIIALLSSSLSCITITLNSKNSPGGSSSSPATSSTPVKPATVVNSASGPTRPHPPARTGTITLGSPVNVTTETINSSGGGIIVSKPGDPLDGFQIVVPPNSYTASKSFKLSYFPIKSQSFGSDINPVSPMITVDNGGGYSDQMLFVKVPVKVPAGYFAMGFIYDEKTKQLEGMPLVSMDESSITVDTCHFSSFFLSAIDKILLKKNIDSGFRPGIDDCEFRNYGSYIAPNGQCSGQSIAAMWYYYAQPDGKDACLYGRYDNNGDQPQTPNFWQDDSLAYRFCSTIHNDYSSWGTASLNWDALVGITWKKVNNVWQRIDVPGIGDENTWRLFAYAIQASGQPQYISVGNQGGDWHAMICYGVSDNGTLLIADPNYSGIEGRGIQFVGNKFKPYNSGANATVIAAGQGTSYDDIVYRGAWTTISYDKISSRWTEFKNRTIGNDRFPVYNLITDKGDEIIRVPLTDGYTTDQKLIDFHETAPGFMSEITVYKEGKKLTKNAQGSYEMSPGNNRLGFLIEGANGGKYVDFKYFNVVYSSLSIDPPSLAGEIDKQYTFTAKPAAPIAGAKYQWYIDGKQQQSDGSVTLKTSFKAEAGYKVAVKQVDSVGKELGSAEATANIKKPAAAPTSVATGKVQISGNFMGVFVLNDWVEQAGNLPPAERDFSLSVPNYADYFNITFNGNAFSGSTVNQYVFVPQQASAQISGTLSADRKTILTLDYTYHYKDSQVDSIGTVKLQNIPFEKQVGNIERYTVKSNLQSHFVSFDLREITYGDNGKKIVERTVKAPPVKDGTVPIISFGIITTPAKK